VAIVETSIGIKYFTAHNSFDLNSRFYNRYPVITDFHKTNINNIDYNVHFNLILFMLGQPHNLLSGALAAILMFA